LRRIRFRFSSRYRERMWTEILVSMVESLELEESTDISGYAGIRGGAATKVGTSNKGSVVVEGGAGTE
jgi:hypothetical protein